MDGPVTAQPAQQLSGDEVDNSSAVEGAASVEDDSSLTDATFNPDATFGHKKEMVDLSRLVPKNENKSTPVTISEDCDDAEEVAPPAPQKGDSNEKPVLASVPSPAPAEPEAAEAAPVSDERLPTNEENDGSAISTPPPAETEAEGVSSADVQQQQQQPPPAEPEETLVSVKEEQKPTEEPLQSKPPTEEPLIKKERDEAVISTPLPAAEPEESPVSAKAEQQPAEEPLQPNLPNEEPLIKKESDEAVISTPLPAVEPEATQAPFKGEQQPLEGPLKADRPPVLPPQRKMGKQLRRGSTGSSRPALEWEKPSWAANPPKLRPTQNGEMIKNPPPPGQTTRRARRGSTGSTALSAIIQWEKPSWAANPPKLRPTGKREVLAKGADIALPITKIRETLNSAANSFVCTEEELATPPDSPIPLQRPAANTLVYPKSAPTRRQKLGKISAEDSAECPKKYEWERPSWLKSKLKATDKGQLAKTKGDLQAPVTKIREKVVLGTEDDGAGTAGADLEKKYKWQKPSWLQQKLKPTEKGQVAKTRGDLQGAITHVEKKHLDNINFEANPMNLKTTDKGGVIRLGESLAKPITKCEKDPMADVNFEANPAFVLQETSVGKAVKEGQHITKPITHVTKPVSWDVNFEANPALLKPTEKGMIAKEKGCLQGPITHVREITKSPNDDVNLEANPTVLKPTEEGEKIKDGQDLALPVTNIRDVIETKDNSNGAELGDAVPVEETS